MNSGTISSLKGLRWTLLKDGQRLSAKAHADLDALISQGATKRTARAWLYREGLRAILDRKQINSSPPCSSNGAPIFCN